MADFDPSIISKIPDMAPNPMAAKDAGYKLADLIDTQQLGRLKLNAAKTDEADREKARNILKDAEYSTPEGITKTAEKLTRARLPDQAMEFMKTMQGLQSSKGQLTKQQYEILSAKNDLIGSAAASLASQYDSLVQRGVPDKQARGMLQPKYQEALQQLGQTKLPDGSPALSPQDLQQIQSNPQFDPQFVRTLAQRSTEGAAALKAQLEFHRQEIADKRQDTIDRQADIADRREQAYEKDVASRATTREIGTEPLGDKELSLAIPTVMADRLALSQFAPAGAKGRTIRKQINEGISDRLDKAGMSQDDLTGLRANVKAQVASVKDLTQMKNNVTAFDGLLKFNATRLLELVDELDDTGVPIIEAPTRMVKRNVWGDKDATEFRQVLNAFQTEAARILTQPRLTGVLTDSARSELQDVVSPGLTAEAGKQLINRILLEASVRKETFNSTLKEATSAMTMPGAAPAAQAPAVGAAAPAVPPATAPPGQGPPPAASDFSHLWN